MLVYQKIAMLVKMAKKEQEEGNNEYYCQELLEKFVQEHLPNGGGFDTKITLDKSNVEKLVFVGDYHVMDDRGHYVGYAPYNIIVEPSLRYDFYITLKGKSKWPKNKAYYGLEDYIVETFNYSLYEDVD